MIVLFNEFILDFGVFYFNVIFILKIIRDNNEIRIIIIVWGCK